MNQVISLIIIAIAGGLFISGCTTLTPEQQEANRRYYEAKERQEKENYMSGLRKKCQDYGYVQGTNAFAKCMQGADMAAQAKKESDDIEYWRSSRAFWCGQGVQSSCDNKPKVTSCSQNLLGQTTCVTQ